ncbi:Hsp70 family protein [Dactylosporangium sp. NPDC049742]|uniref:Hsp70 family protein n=1 Tax=Dactylosporangium sp. NPDC049742 TaxID=3154737 RepID=UPI0034454DD6
MAYPQAQSWLAIDYGTSNTVAMLSWPDGRVRPLLFDSSPLLPSAVCVDDDGRLLTGRAAQRKARLVPQAYEPNPKRRVDDLELLLGEQSVPIVTLVGATLGRVWQEAVRALSEPPAKVVITCPVEWGPARQSVLLDAARHAGLPEVTLLPEPTAAATYFATVLGRELPQGGCLVVYDLGAGTFDVSVVRRGPETFEPLSFRGLDDFGGLDLDEIVLSIVGDIAGRTAPDEWQRLRNPSTTAESRAFRTLWQDASEVKEALSAQSSAALLVPLVDQDVLVTREQFEELARPRLADTIRITTQCMREARVAPEQVGAVFLVGGGTRMPLIATMLHQATGIAPTVLDQPELVVAEGALRSVAHLPAPAFATAAGPVSPPFTQPAAPVTPAETPAAPASPAAAPAPQGFPHGAPAAPASPAAGPVSPAVSVPVSGPFAAPVSGSFSAPFTSPGSPAVAPVSGPNAPVSAPVGMDSPVSGALQTSAEWPAGPYPPQPGLGTGYPGVPSVPQQGGSRPTEFITMPAGTAVQAVVLTVIGIAAYLLGITLAADEANTYYSSYSYTTSFYGEAEAASALIFLCLPGCLMLMAAASAVGGLLRRSQLHVDGTGLRLLERDPGPDLRLKAFGWIVPSLALAIGSVCFVEYWFEDGDEGWLLILPFLAGLAGLAHGLLKLRRIAGIRHRWLAQLRQAPPSAAGAGVAIETDAYRWSDVHSVTVQRVGANRHRSVVIVPADRSELHSPASAHRRILFSGTAFVFADLDAAGMPARRVTAAIEQVSGGKLGGAVGR